MFLGHTIFFVVKGLVIWSYVMVGSLSYQGHKTPYTNMYVYQWTSDVLF